MRRPPPVAAAAVQPRPHRRPDIKFTPEAFPNLSPEACAFFNTPIDECDPEMLGPVLATLAEFLAGVMTPREGMQDARDVLAALSNRLAGLLPEALPVPPAPLADAAPDAPDVAAVLPPTTPPAWTYMLLDPPDVAAVLPPTTPLVMPDTATIAAIAAPAATPDFPRPAAQESTQRQGDAAASPRHSARTGTTGPGESAVASAGSPPAIDAEIDTNVRSAGTVGSSGIRPPKPRQNLFHGEPHFRIRNLAPRPRDMTLACRNRRRFLPPPPRLLCYAACAGPPAIPRAPD